MKYILLLIAGALFANFVPHFVHGISGKPFFLPRRTNREKLNSPILNVLWGFANLVAGVALLGYAFRWSAAFWTDTMSLIFGALILSVVVSASYEERRRLAAEVARKSEKKL